MAHFLKKSSLNLRQNHIWPILMEILEAAGLGLGVDGLDNVIPAS